MCRWFQQRFGGVLQEEFLNFYPGDLLGSQHAYASNFIFTDVEVIDNHTYEQVEQEHVADDNPGYEV